MYEGTAGSMESETLAGSLTSKLTAGPVREGPHSHGAGSRQRAAGKRRKNSTDSKDSSH